MGTIKILTDKVLKCLNEFERNWHEERRFNATLNYVATIDMPAINKPV